MARLTGSLVRIRVVLLAFVVLLVLLAESGTVLAYSAQQTSLGVQFNSSTSYVGILYDKTKDAQVVPGATWTGTILSDPLDRSTLKAFADKMHAAGLLVAGTINRSSVKAATSVALTAVSVGFDMIILDEVLSLYPGVFDASSFNKLLSKIEMTPKRTANVVVGMSDYDVTRMTQFLASGAKPDFIAITTYYADLSICQAKIDAIALLASQYQIPAYDWVSFADGTAVTTIDQTAMSALASYANSKVNGVWFWEYGDLSWSGWSYGDWYITNYDYVVSLVGTL